MLSTRCRVLAAGLFSTLVLECAVAQERSEAVVLRGVDFSETSRIVTFLTPERGRLACIAKGYRRKKGSYAGALDTFNRVELVYAWKEGREVQTLIDATLLDAWPKIKQNVEKATYGAFPLELVYKTAHENEPSEPVFDALVRGLESLTAWQQNVPFHTGWHALQLLAAAGFAPALDSDEQAEQLHFLLDEGLSASSGLNAMRVSAAALAALRRMEAAPEACPDAPSAELAAGPEVLTLLERYAAYQLDAEFRSLRVARAMFGNE